MSNYKNEEQIQGEEYSLYFDGACKGNPGPAGAGYVLYQGSREVSYKYEFVGINETNNVAEYHALVLGLKQSLSCGVRNLIVYGDSLLVINQVTGKFNVNSHKLNKYYEFAIELSKQFESVRFQHIPREKNKRADELANLSLRNISI
jgi:ribonuclease HI